jgi:hypothetical protein
MSGRAGRFGAGVDAGAGFEEPDTAAGGGGGTAPVPVPDTGDRDRDEPDDDGARSFVKEIASFPQADSVRRLVRTTSSINDRIQPIATPIVIFVNTSPALVPNALEPPTPPNAPAKPPPLPRWIRMMQIMNSEPRTIKALRMPMRKLTRMSLEDVGQT